MTPASDPATLYDPPTPGDLVEAVREYLEDQVADLVPDSGHYHFKVALAALRLVERQLEQAPKTEPAHRDRLAALGHVDDRSLARALRDGTQDPQAPELITALRATVRDKLAVSNPRYLKEN